MFAECGILDTVLTGNRKCEGSGWNCTCWVVGTSKGSVWLKGMGVGHETKRGKETDLTGSQKSWLTPGIL